MRTLVIAGDYPWPEDRGPRLRLAMVLRGLRRCGSVELFSVVSRFRTDIDPPDASLGLDRVARVGFDNRPAPGRTGPRPGPPVAARPSLAGRADGPPGVGPVRLGPLRPGLVLRGPPLGTVRRTGAGPHGARPRRPRGPEDPGPAGRAPPTGVSGRRARTAGGAACPARRSGGGSGSTAVPAGRPRLWWSAASSTPSGPGAAVARVAVIPNAYRWVDHPLGRVPVGHRPPCCSRASSATRPTSRPPGGWPTRWPPGWPGPGPDLAVRLVGEHGPELSTTSTTRPGSRWWAGSRTWTPSWPGSTWWSCRCATAAGPGSRSSRPSPNGSRWCRPPVGRRGDRRRGRRAPARRRRRPGPGRGVRPPADRARAAPRGRRCRPPPVRGAVLLRRGRRGRGPTGRRCGRREVIAPHRRAARPGRGGPPRTVQQLPVDVPDLGTGPGDVEGAAARRRRPRPVGGAGPDQRVSRSTASASAWGRRGGPAGR